MEDVCERIKVHQGYNIRRVRAASQIKQEILAQKIGVAQQTLSKYENQEVVDEEILNKCAKELDVPVDLLKNMPYSQEAPIHYFKDVNFINSAMGGSYGDVFTYNYSDKVVMKALQDEINRLKKENEALKAERNKK